MQNNTKPPIHVCVTGAAGQIGYALLPLICSGAMFGEDQPIALHLLEIPQAQTAVGGVKLQLQDCAYPLLHSIMFGDDPKKVFDGIDVGIFVGGFPRKQGMQRKELLEINAKIFKEQGSALNEVAKKDCKCLVVANPANTNCLTLSTYAPNLPKENFTALTRLDHNRAAAQICIKAGMPLNLLKNVTIWGNHSSTQFPDIAHAKIDGKSVNEQLKEHADWLKGDFITTVQKRGAAIIAARKLSSALSAANAIKDHIRDWYLGNDSTWVSMAVITGEGAKYGVDKNLCFSYPVTCKGNWEIEIVDGLEHDEFAKEKLKITEDELKAERVDAGIQ